MQSTNKQTPALPSSPASTLCWGPAVLLLLLLPPLHHVPADWPQQGAAVGQPQGVQQGQPQQLLWALAAPWPFLPEAAQAKTELQSLWGHQPTRQARLSS